MVSALRDIVSHACSLVTLEPGDVVVDIGANDGTLLRMYPEGVTRIAYEPAENLWPALQANGGGFSAASGNGIGTIFGYFPQVLNDDVVGMEPGAKIITSIACFYDSDDPNRFVEGIKKCLAPGGVWINQLAYLPDTLATNNFGDICHEHLTYWTLGSMTRLLERHGLAIESWSHNDVNGGSFRLVVRHAAEVPMRYDQNNLTPIMDSQWHRFRNMMLAQRDQVRSWLIEARHNGQKVIGYGASTKGNTYLQYWGIGADLLPLIADRNPDKYGKYTPTGQLVISEAEARDLEPDAFFVLPFHFLDAFVEREHLFLARGGQFVVPFPTFRLVNGGGVDANLQPEETVPDNRVAVRS